MKKFALFILSLLFLNSYLYANKIEDSAFKEYSNKNYTKALQLYTKASSKNSLKSLLMVALFYEKGLGVKQDSKRAIKLYKTILNKSSNIRVILSNKKRFKIVTIALTRLTKLTKNNKYLNLAKKLQKLETKMVKEKKSLFNNKATNIDDFFVLCPFAALVTPEDRIDLDKFACELFENFPKKMALFMKLRRIRFDILKKQEANFALKLSKIDIKISKLIKPMIKFLQQESIDCYGNSETVTDIKACDYDYLLKTDPLLFDHAADRMEKDLDKHPIKDHKLDDFERNDLINELIKNISNNTYGNSYRSMVQ